MRYFYDQCARRGWSSVGIAQIERSETSGSISVNQGSPDNPQLTVVWERRRDRPNALQLARPPREARERLGTANGMPRAAHLPAMNVETTVTKGPSNPLGIKAGGRALRVHRLRLADGEPMSIDTSHLPARRFPGLRRQLDRHPSLYETLAAVYGVRLAEAEETIETVLAGPEDARLLGVDVGLPLLLLSRHAVDTSGQPVEYAQSWYRGDRYKFVTRLRPPPEAPEEPA